MKGQAKIDWLKVIKVIMSINDTKQLESAHKLINNYKRLHGFGENHKLLELKLKTKRLELRR